MTRRCTHGPAWSLAHWRCSRRASAGVQMGSRGQLRLGRAVVDAEPVEHGDRDVGVPEGVEVHPVVVPDRPRRGTRASATCRRPGRRGRRRSRGPVRCRCAIRPRTGRKIAEIPGSYAVNITTRRAGRGQPADRRVVRRGEARRCRPGAQDVVGAGVDRDQVGRQSATAGSICSSMIAAQLAAADRRGWRSRSRRSVRGQHLGDPVGPAPQTVGAGRVGVADPLGEGVAERDVPVEVHDG